MGPTETVLKNLDLPNDYFGYTLCYKTDYGKYH